MSESNRRLGARTNDAARLTRREMLGSAALSGASFAVLGAIGAGGASAEADSGLATPSPLGKTEILPLLLDPKKLRGLSEKLIVSHHARNYAGAVKRLNLIELEIAALPADAAPFRVGSLKREELIASNSMILHELYFANLGGDGEIAGRSARALKSEWGSIEAWDRDFRQTALSLGGGSGWVVVAYDLRRRRLRNVWSWDHAHQPASAVPLLVLDLYEHAYHMDYGADTQAYVDAFLANVRWDEVDRRLERALGFPT